MESQMLACVSKPFIYTVMETQSIRNDTIYSTISSVEMLGVSLCAVYSVPCGIDLTP